MQRLQFSLSGVFLLTVIVAVVVAFADRFASEGFLLALSLAAFCCSFGNFRQSGWRKILRVTFATGAVWSACIGSTHLMYVNVPGPRDLAWRALFLMAIGLLVAFTLAWGLYGLTASVRRWFRATPGGKIVSAATLLLVVVTGLAAWNADLRRFLQPTLVEIDTIPDLPSSLGRRLADRLGIDSRKVCVMPDGRFVATRHPEVIRVLDADSGNVVASFPAAEGEWFASLTFLRDNRHLAAVQYLETGEWKLIQWDSRDWTTRDPVSLSDFVVPSRPDTSYPLLCDHTLLIVNVHNAPAETARVEIKSLDLLDASQQPQEFCSASIERSGPLGRDWTLSSNRRWLVNSGPFFPRSVSVFGRGNQAAKVSGELRGFLPGGEQIVLDQQSSRVVWQAYPRSPVVDPPFWNHLQSVRIHRVAVFDCPTNRIVGQSRWSRVKAGE